MLEEVFKHEMPCLHLTLDGSANKTEGTEKGELEEKRLEEWKEMSKSGTN